MSSGRLVTQRLDNKTIGRVTERGQGDRHRDGLIRKGIGCEDVSVPCKCHERVSALEGEFSNQVDKMAHPLDMSNPLSAVTPAFA